MLTLRSEILEATLLPEVGGCIVALDLTGPRGAEPRPVLLAPSRDAALAGQAAQSAHFLMLPWANRVPGNRLLHDGEPIEVPRNTPEPLALHGVGWQRPWSVLESTPDRCVMEVESPADYPIPFSARQEVQITAGTLLISVVLRNAGTRALPLGMGFHPYFPRDASTRLTFEADWFWLEGPGHMPTDAIRVPPELDFHEGRLLPGRWRANCYSGWRGSVVIEQPASGYRVVMSGSEGLTDLMFYTPPGEPFWAIEPQSHTTAQVDTRSREPAARPIRSVAPGDQLTEWMRLDISEL